MKWNVRKMAAIAAVAALCLPLAGARPAHAASGPSLEDLKSISKRCDAGGAQNVLIAIDAGGAPSKRASQARLAIAGSETLRAAVCGDRLKVVSFTSSVTSTRTLTDTVFRPAGSTENARMWAASQSARDATSALRTKWRTSRGLSDPLGALLLATEFDRIILLTSGLGSGIEVASGVRGSNPEEVAVATELPDLTGKTVQIKTLGVSKNVTTAFARDVLKFWTSACASTHAECTVTMGL